MELFSILSLYVLTKIEKEILKTIGIKIRRVRLHKKISQAQIAFEMQTSTKHYQRIEYGQINTSIINLYKIAEVLEIDVKEIIP